jgi:hypothetical protein
LDFSPEGASRAASKAGIRTTEGSKVRKRLAVSSLALAIVFVFWSVIFAQTSKREAPGVKSAATAPDLSGIWLERQNAITFSRVDPPLQPWAEAKFRTVKPGYGPRASPNSQDPILNCYPPGLPRIMLIPFPMQIVQIQGEVLMLFEYDHFVRHIYIDRREHPKDLDLTWMGDSIGRWDGDTLVVDTIGLNDKSWLDQVGHPHSDALHIVERIRRVDHDTLEDDLTIDDPKVYTRPWTGQQSFKLRPGWHLIEYICEAHMDEFNK